MLLPAQTTQLLDIVEHMFDRLHYLEVSTQKMRGAIEALEMWSLENADSETLYARPTTDKAPSSP